MLLLLVTANFVPSSPIPVTPIMEVILPSGISVFTRAVRRKITRRRPFFIVTAVVTSNLNIGIYVRPVEIHVEIQMQNR
jgi:hypothetical protein